MFLLGLNPTQRLNHFRQMSLDYHPDWSAFILEKKNIRHMIKFAEVEEEKIQINLFKPKCFSSTSFDTFVLYMRR